MYQRVYTLPTVVLCLPGENPNNITARVLDDTLNSRSHSTSSTTATQYYVVQNRA